MQGCDRYYNPTRKTIRRSRPGFFSLKKVFFISEELSGEIQKVEIVGFRFTTPPGSDGKERSPDTGTVAVVFYR